MPDLHCGVEVQAAIDAGFTVGFYRVGSDLCIDEYDLERKLSRQPGAVFVIHYFGFGQPSTERITTLCQRRGCVVIEDCAHSLFSRYNGRLLGEYAPLAVFSLRKTLPVYDGGAVQVNPSLLREVAEDAGMLLPETNVPWQWYIVYAKSALHRLLGEKVTALYHRLRWRTREAGNQTVQCSSGTPRSYNFALSFLSRRIAEASDHTELVKRRRHNYITMDQMLAGSPGYKTVFDCLPTGTCPLFLPIWVSRREDLMNALLDRGIETFRFGAVPHATLTAGMRANTAALRENIICIPVHDQLIEADLDRITGALKELLPLYAPAKVHGQRVQP